MKVSYQTNPREWIQAITDGEKKEAKALTLAMRDVTRLAVTAGRNAIQAAGFSSKFANSLVGKIPKDFTLDPSGFIHTTINYADVFERGATIAGRPYIWLPLPTVPPIAGRPHMTPKQYVQNVGPLVTMHRAGKPPMLGARIQTGRLPPQPFGRFVSRRRLARGIGGRGQFETVPLFVGVPAINIPKKFDVEAAVEGAFEQFDELYKKYSEAE